MKEIYGPNATKNKNDNVPLMTSGADWRNP